MTMNETGFEGKPLRVVIINWIYPVNDDAERCAELELRRRFTKSFKKPDLWS